MWKKLFIECGKIGKPVHFSTGMANENEVLDSLNALLSTNTSEVTVYQCNSAYPTPVQDANLNKIKTLKRIVKKSNNLNDIRINIGYSDHTVSPSVIYRAIHKFNVKYVEFHIDLDGQGAEYKAGHCWLPDDMGNVISTSKLAFEADGLSNFHPSNSELPDRDWRADPNDGLRPLKKLENLLMVELCIGTAQFGMQYGIANRTGKPSSKEISNIVDFSLINGIHYFDTAQSYGDSEFNIGKAFENSKNQSSVKVITKLSPDVNYTDPKIVIDSVYASLKRLKLKTLYGFLAHRFEAINDVYFAESLQILKKEINSTLWCFCLQP